QRCVYHWKPAWRLVYPNSLSAVGGRPGNCCDDEVLVLMGDGTSGAIVAFRSRERSAACTIGNRLGSSFTRIRCPPLAPEPDIAVMTRFSSSWVMVRPA